MALTPVGTALQNAITSGEPLAVTLGDVVAEAAPPASSISVYTIELGIGLGGGLSMLDAVLPGATVSGCIGTAESLLQGVLDPANTTITVQSVSFVLAPAGASLVAMSIDIALAGQGSNPVSLTLGSTPGSPTIGLDQIVVTLAAPAQGGGPNISAALWGTLALAEGVTVGASLELPSVTLRLDLVTPTVASTPGLPVATLLSAFGLQSSSLLSGLYISDFEFVLDLSALTFATSLSVVAEDGPPGGGAISLDAATTSVDFDGTTFDAGVFATLNLMGEIAVDAAFSVSVPKGSGPATWQLNAGLDVPQTLQNLNAIGTAVTLAQLLGQLEPDQTFTFPGADDWASNVEVTKLVLGGTYADGSSNASITATVGLLVQWTIGGSTTEDSIATQLTITNSGPGTTSVQLEATIEIDGFEFDASWTAPAGGSPAVTLTMGGLTGTYAVSTQTLTIDFEGNQSLGSIVSTFVGLFTDNPNVVLTPPWDALNSANLSNVQLVLDFNAPGGVGGSIVAALAMPIPVFTATIDAVGLRRTPGSAPQITISGSGIPSSLSWDVTKPAATPQLNGAGTQVLDVELIAAGQNVSFSPPDTVDAAIVALQGLVRGAGNASVTPPAFSAAAGWLLGVKLLIEQQATLQFAFADPSFYGAQLTVGPPPASGGLAYLAALQGLDAEILYRKVNQTTGVYEGQLTLPTSISQLDFGAFQLHLPQLSAAVYTDGEFSIDIGYPTNGDFSQSASVVAGNYSGAGGVYFARLDPGNASGLPALSTGEFGIATGFGFGLQLGVGYGFSAGPLSAALGVKLTGMFDGIFAQFIATNAGPSPLEYYAVQASVTIVGTITGSANFVIISASVLVQVGISVSVSAIAGEPVIVPVSATVQISVTATINLLLCTISKTFNFSYDLSYTATFGSTQDYPWVPGATTLARPRARDGLRLTTPLEARVAAPLGPFAPIPGANAALNLYVYPVWTQSTGNAVSDGWVQVVELGLLSNDAASPDMTTYAQTVFTWFGLAYCAGAGLPVSQDPVAFTMTAAQVASMQAALQALTKDSAVPAPADVQAFLSTNFTFAPQSPADSPPAQQSQAVNLAPFPFPPGMSVAWAAQGSGSTISGSTQPIEAAQQEMLRDHLVLTALACLNAIVGAMEADDSWTLAQMTGCIAQNGESIDGMLSRLMLHGGRHRGVPLYVASGQQAAVPFTLPTSPQAQVETISLTIDSSSRYGIDGLPYQLESGLVASPAAIAAFDPAPFSTSTITCAVGPFVIRVPRQFPLLGGAQVANGVGGILPFNSDLLQLLQTQPDGVAATLLDPDGNAAAGSAGWATTITFTVRAQTAGSQTLPMYVIGPMPAASVELLATVYPQLDTLSPTTELFWPTGPGAAASLDGVTVGGGSAFVYPNNLSTQEDPPGADLLYEVAMEPAAPLVLGRLLASALTNRGGFYLYVAQGIPAGAFDAQGVARMTLVLSFGGGATVLPYYTGIRTAPGSTAATVQVTDDNADLIHPALSTGQVVFTLTNTPGSGGDGYSSTLDSLFNMVGFAPIATHGGETIADLAGAELVASPTGQTEGQWVYSQLYDLYTSSANAVLPLFRDSSDLTALPGVMDLLSGAADPYQFVGVSLTTRNQWMDLFGNTVPIQQAGGQIATTVVPWSEPLLTLGNWPGITVGYVVERDLLDLDRRVLRVALAWKPPAAASGQRVPYGIQYARLYHQLAYVDVQVSTTLTTAPLTSLAGLARADSPSTVLRRKIATILEALERGDETPLDLGGLTFALPRDDSAYETAAIYQLSTSIEFNLRAGIEVAAPFTAAQIAALQSLVPAHDPSAASGALSFRYFARKLEDALSSLDAKVMAGQTDGDATPNFWILRYGPTGLSFSVQLPQGASPIGYAPQPLGTQLITRSCIAPDALNAAITALSADNPYLLPAANTVSVSNLDLDLAMRQLLATLESVLAPASGIPAELVTAAGGQSAADLLLSAKQTLAATFASYVQSLSMATSGADDPALPVARTAYQQAVLKSATNFYGVDAVAAYQLVPHGPPLGQTCNVFGHLLDRSGALEGGIGVSPVICPVAPGGNSIFTTAVSVQQKGMIDEFVLPDGLRIDAIQIVQTTVDIDVVGSGDPVPYEMGTWLHFVIPPAEDIDCPRVGLSLPLRSQPTDPTLVSQGVQPAPASAPGDALQQAKSWTLTLAYQHHYVAQDTVCATFTVNPVVASSTSTPNPAETDLADALALYQALVPSIAPGLATLAGDASASSTSAGGLAVLAFAAAVRLVAQQLPVLPTAPGFVLDEASQQFSFALTEGPENSDEYLSSRWVAAVQLEPGSRGSSASLLVQIPGYTAEVVRGAKDAPGTFYAFRAPGGGYLTEKQAAMIADRTLALVGTLDVVGAQTAIATLLVQRNRFVSLESNQPLPGVFQLSTQEITFTSPIRPFLVADGVVDLTALSGAPQTGTLAAYLTGFLTGLAATSLASTQGLTPQLTAWLNVPLRRSGGAGALAPVISLPIALLPFTTNVLPPNATAANASYLVGQIATAVQGWLETSNWPSSFSDPAWSGVSFGFRVLVYPPAGVGAGLPFLGLENVVLPVAALTGIQ